MGSNRGRAPGAETMGDRAMAEVRTEDGSFFFYTHCTGHRLPADARAALKKAAPRKTDTSYAARIVLDHLILASGARDEETGAGLMLKPRCEDSYNDDKPSVVIDLQKWTVRAKGHSRR